LEVRFAKQLDYWIGRREFVYFYVFEKIDSYVFGLLCEIRTTYHRVKHYAVRHPFAPPTFTTKCILN